MGIELNEAGTNYGCDNCTVFGFLALHFRYIDDARSWLSKKLGWQIIKDETFCPRCRG